MKDKGINTHFEVVNLGEIWVEVVVEWLKYQSRCVLCKVATPGLSPSWVRFVAGWSYIVVHKCIPSVTNYTHLERKMGK